MGCNYKLKAGTLTLIFNSRQELADFIVNNKYRLSLENDGFVKFSISFDRMQEIAAKLQNINQKAKDLTITRDKFGNKIYGGHGYTSVTRALSMPDILGDGARPLIAEFDFDKLWVKLAEKIQEENGGRLTPEELDRMKIETEKKYENIAVLGTAVHKIMELSFLNPSWDNVTLASEFTKTREYTTSPINDTNVRDAIEYVNKLKDYLKRMHGDDAIFLPELKITSNNDAGKKIVGKIDLLVVDKNGHVHIYDFKASPKSFRDFGKIKELSFHYLMEFYRLMLSLHGINVSNTSLNILPIQFLSENPVGYDKISTDMDVMTLDTKGGEYSYVSENVAKILPSREISYMSNTDDYNKFNNLSNELFGYSLEEKGLQNIPRPNQMTSGHNAGKWVFNNLFTGKFVMADTEEEINQLFEEYLSKTRDNKISYAQNAAVEFKKAKAKGLLEFDIKSDKNAKYNQHLARYLQGNWQIDETMLPLGVLLFYHPDYKIVEMVYVTNQDIRKEVKGMAYESNGKLITGNLIHDSKAKEYTLDANVGNVELMRLMVIANEIMPSFSEYSLNALKVISNNHKYSAYQSMDMLKKNFDQLVYLANQKKPDLNLVNNFISTAENKIGIVSAETRLLNEIDEVLNSTDEARVRFAFLKNIHNNYSTIYSMSKLQKILRLTDILNAIRDQLLGSPKYDMHNNLLDPLQNLNTDPLARIYWVAADALAQVAEMDYEYQFNDVGKWDAHNEYLAPAQLTKAKIFRNMQLRIIDTTRNAIRKDLRARLTPMKIVAEDYINAEGKIDTSWNAFDRMIERDKIGDNETLRVKNPYTNSLPDTDTKFLKSWLETINRIRYPETNGDHTTAEALRLIETGEWFDIPVMRGGKINRGVFSVESIKNNIMDLYDRAKNPLETLAKMQQDKQRTQEERFDYFINALKMDTESRLQLLNDKGSNYFSRDLAEVAFEMIYLDTLEENWNRSLPLLRTGLICSSAVGIMTDTLLKNYHELMMEKMQTVVYQKVHVDPKVMPFYLGYLTLSNLANIFTLAFNPVSFVREMFTGWNNNISRGLSKYGGKNTPSMANLAKALAIVAGQGFDAIFHENLMNGFNMTYNISGRATAEMKETLRALSGVIAGLIGRNGALYWLQLIPDYNHRMTLFIAYLLEMGIYDCYSFNQETKQVEYDFSKDPRFKFLDAFKRNGVLDPKDKTNLAVYNMLMEEFNKTRSDGDKLKFGDDLPDGICDVQIDTIKNLANQIHGTMDPETKMHASQYWWAQMMLKFQTHIPSKLLLWTLKPGKYQFMEEFEAVDEETGKPLYIKLSKNADGEMVVGETTDPNEEGCTGQRVMRFGARYEAGLWYAIKDLTEALRDSKNRSEKLRELFSNEAKTASLKNGLLDLLLLLILGMLASLGVGASLASENPFAGKLTKAAAQGFSDNNPITLASGVLSAINPVTFAVNGKILDSTISWLTKEDYDARSYLYNSFGFGKWLGFF